MSETTNTHEPTLQKEQIPLAAVEGRDEPDFIFAMARLETDRANPRSPGALPGQELVDQLSGTIANRFNNLMMSITSQADVELKKAQPSPAKKNWERLLVNATKATCLIQKLLSMGRTQSGTVLTNNLNLIVQELDGVLQAMVSDDVQVITELSPAVGNVKAGRAQLEYLLLSVVSAFSSSLTSGGTIRLTSEIGHPPNSSNSPASPTDTRVILSIEVSARSTNGNLPEGFSERARTLGNKRLAAAIAATGVGVDDAHGFVTIRQGVGGSTKLSLYLLPLTEDPISNIPTPSVALANAKTILIVEDDNAVRTPTSEFLKMEGFRVLQARNGTEALTMVQQNQTAIDLLVTDMNMPELTGQELAERLVDLYPSTKVLFMTGDASQINSDARRSHLNSFTMQKPFRLNILMDRIHDLLRD
ncbi:MAG TPA: response regulator [Terriglobales bacterium]|nr:response regulator [Terriglobales bacterium]